MFGFYPHLYLDYFLIIFGNYAAFKWYSELENSDFPVLKNNFQSHITHWEQLQLPTITAHKADFVFQFGHSIENVIILQDTQLRVFLKLVLHVAPSTIN